MLDLAPEHLEMVLKILKNHAPNLRVIAFGSRVTGKAKPHSDLDLALMTASPLSIGEIGKLREAFSESDLPMRVDLTDWAETSEGFRKIIMEHHVEVQKG